MEKTLTVLLAISCLLLLLCACEKDTSPITTETVTGTQAPTVSDSTEAGDPFADAKIGDTVCFGYYEQDDDRSTGAEAIEWIVLDKQDGCLLIISKNVLECKPYHNSTSGNETWMNCSLHSWLNDVFLKDCFNTEERAAILPCEVTEENAKPVTGRGDKVFLLSVAEAKKYFSSDEDRCGAPTSYVSNLGATKSGTFSSGAGPTCSWGLRTFIDSGNHAENAAVVTKSGQINENGLPIIVYFGIRPAMWISIDP